MTQSPPRPRRVLATSPFAREEVTVPSTADFHIGDRVVHDSCGLGRVLSVSEHFVTVDFGSAGVRQLSAGARGFALL